MDIKAQKPRSVIFLDVDGVLNNCSTDALTPTGYTGLDPDNVMNLYKLVKRTGADIVLSSDWRYEWKSPTGTQRGNDAEYLNEMLNIAEMQISDKTPETGCYDFRGREIRTWLDKHPDVKNWVVLDDIYFLDFQENGISPHLVLTDPRRGLTVENIKLASKILKGETL